MQVDPTLESVAATAHPAGSKMLLGTAGALRLELLSSVRPSVVGGQWIDLLNLLKGNICRKAISRRLFLQPIIPAKKMGSDDLIGLISKNSQILAYFSILF